MRSNSGQRKETRHGQGKALAGAEEVQFGSWKRWWTWSMNKRWQWTGQSMTCQLPSSVHAPSSSFLTPRCSSGAPANASWPRHASPVNTGAEHFSILAFYAQQQWTEERDTSWPRKSIGKSSRESKMGVRNVHEHRAWTEDGNGQGRAWPADEHYAAVCGSIWRIKNLKVTHKSANI